MTVRQLVGDARVQLATVEGGSAQTCITSPPYWGLRNYGTPPLIWGGDAEHAHTWGQPIPGDPRGGSGPNAKEAYGPDYGRQVPRGCGCLCGAWLGSLGLEPTPELYVEHIVECFRHVRRVLRDDGTLWVNLGASYAGAGKGPSGQNGIGGQSERQGWSGSRRVPAYGSDGIGRSGLPDPDSACSDLCGECRAVLLNHNAGKLPHHPAGASLVARIDRDIEHRGSAGVPLAVSLPDALKSTTSESSPRPPAECSHCANCGACLSVLRSSSRDARLCVRKTAGLSATDSIAVAIRDLCLHTLDTGAIDDSFLRRTVDTVYDSAQRNSTITPRHYKPKDLIDIPSMVAEALRADGWWLRSVIPWLKRNSMPESCRDRPSTAVEYIFMLSKSARYFYDADAIRVGLTQAGVQMTTNLVDKGPALVQHFGAQPVATDGRINLAVGIAATILQFAEAQDDLRLLPLDAEVRQEDADSLARLDVTLMPVICRATAHAVRFARQDISAEQFLSEINRLRIALADGNRLHESWRVALFDRAGVNEDRDAAIGVKHSGEVGQVEWFQRNKDTTGAPLSPKAGGTPRNDGVRWNENNGRGFIPQQTGRNRRNSDWFFESWQGLMLDEQDDPLALVVNPQPFNERHFATFPPKLVEPMVKASTSERGQCPECGAPWVRVVERGPLVDQRANPGKPSHLTPQGYLRNGKSRCGVNAAVSDLGWRASCTCCACPENQDLMLPHSIGYCANLPPVPQTVLDPFGGAGTVGLVADRLGRNAVLVDLKPEYSTMAVDRLTGDAPMFVQVTEAPA